MIHAITLAPDLELILVDELRAYFQNEANTADLFRNYPAIRVSQTHPFAHLIDQAVNGTNIPVDLFPSVTVVSESDSKSVQMPAILTEANIGSSEIQHMVENRELYIMSDQTLKDLQELVTARSVVFAQGSSTIRGLSLSIEIWAENIDLKNKIYDLVQAFIMGKKRYDVNEKYGIKLQEHSMTGQRSGLYNFDFGKLLYGGSIRVPVDVPYSQFFVDSDQAEITSVAVNTNKGVW